MTDRPEKSKAGWIAEDKDPLTVIEDEFFQLKPGEAVTQEMFIG
jgi:hypothetical protein